MSIDPFLGERQGCREYPVRIRQPIIAPDYHENQLNFALHSSFSSGKSQKPYGSYEVVENLMIIQNTLIRPS